MKPEMSKKVLTFSVFLLIAIIFWFLNALDKEYVTEIEIPLTYHNLPHDKELAHSRTNKLSVKIRGYGFNIVGKLPKPEEPLSVNLHKSAVRISERTDKYYVRTAQLKEVITAGTPDVFTVLSIKPDTLFLELRNVDYKKVPVAPAAIHFAESYIMSAPLRLTPDSVFIYGKTDSLKSVKQIETFEYTEKISQSTRIQLKLKSPPGISLKQTTVDASVKAEQYSEKQIELQPKVLNIPDSLRLITFPRKIKLKLKIPLSIYNEINADNFKASIDFKQIENEKPDFISPKIEFIPISDFVFPEEELRPQPEKLDFIIEKDKQK